MTAKFQKLVYIFSSVSVESSDSSLVYTFDQNEDSYDEESPDALRRAKLKELDPLSNPGFWTSFLKMKMEACSVRMGPEAFQSLLRSVDPAVTQQLFR